MPQQERSDDRRDSTSRDLGQARPHGQPEVDSLKQRLPLHEEAAAIRLHVDRAMRLVDERARGGGLSIPKEFTQLAAALTALNFPVVGGSSGFGAGQYRNLHSNAPPPQPGFPVIVIGETPRSFELRFSGHGEAFAAELDTIRVPLLLRLRYPATVGLRGLTPESAAVVLNTEVKAAYPHLAQEVERAYHRSAQATSSNRPLEDELMRRECNIALALSLKRYIEDFRHDSRASIGNPVTLISSPGQLLQLCGGDPLDCDSGSNELRGNSLRGLMVGERQTALISFGSFLREQALRGG